MGRRYALADTESKRPATAFRAFNANLMLHSLSTTRGVGLIASGEGSGRRPAAGTGRPNICTSSAERSTGSCRRSVVDRTSRARLRAPPAAASRLRVRDGAARDRQALLRTSGADAVQRHPDAVPDGRAAARVQRDRAPRDARGRVRGDAGARGRDVRRQPAVLPRDHAQGHVVPAGAAAGRASTARRTSTWTRICRSWPRRLHRASNGSPPRAAGARGPAVQEELRGDTRGGFGRLSSVCVRGSLRPWSWAWTWAAPSPTPSC